MFTLKQFLNTISQKSYVEVTVGGREAGNSIDGIPEELMEKEVFMIYAENHNKMVVEVF